MLPSIFDWVIVILELSKNSHQLISSANLKITGTKLVIESFQKK